MEDRGVRQGQSEPAANRSTRPHTRITTVPGGNPDLGKPHVEHPKDDQEEAGEEQASSLQPS